MHHSDRVFTATLIPSTKNVSTSSASTSCEEANKQLLWRMRPNQTIYLSIGKHRAGAKGGGGGTKWGVRTVVAGPRQRPGGGRVGVGHGERWHHKTTVLQHWPQGRS